MVSAYWHKLRLFDREAWLAIAVWMAIGLCMDGVLAVVLNLYLLRLGYGPEFVGLANGVSMAAGAVAAPLAGLAGTRLGLRPALLIGLITNALTLAAFSLAGLLPAWREAWLLSTLSLNAMGMTFLMVNLPPFMMSVTEPLERTHVFSLSQAMRPLAALLGSLLGGLLPGIAAAALGVTLAQAMPYGWALLCAPLLSIPVILAMLLTRIGPGRVVQSEQAADGPAPWGLMISLAVVFAVLFCGTGPTLFVNVYLDAGLHTPTGLIGALIGLGKLVAIPMALALPFLAGRYGLFRVTAASMAGMALGVLLIVTVPHWAMAGAGYILWSSFFALCNASFGIFSNELVAPRWRPTMSGMSGTLISLGMATATYGGGYVIESRGYRTLFFLGAAVSAVALGIFCIRFRHSRAALAQAEATEGV